MRSIVWRIGAFAAAALSCVAWPAAAASTCDLTELQSLFASSTLCPELTTDSSHFDISNTTLCDNLNCIKLVNDIDALGMGDCIVPGTSIRLSTDYLDAIVTECMAVNPDYWSSEETIEGSGSSSSSSSDSGSSTGAIIGGVAGGVVVLLAIGGYCLWRNKKKKRMAASTTNDAESGGNTKYIETLSPLATENNSTARLTSANRTGTLGTGRSTIDSAQFLATVPAGGLWDDEAIIAARIPREKVSEEILVSRGGYGEVYIGNFNGKRVAIKTLLPETRKNLKQINAFLAEVKLMASLDHPQIVQFVGVAWDSLTDLCVVLEYMEGGDLRALLMQFEEVEHRPHGFDHDKVKMAKHIAHALTYLHSLEPIVLHRDLKSKNILLDNDLNAKLTDFGVSRERSDRTMTAGVGTSLWMAPEVMMGERYDQKADVFSFGVVLSELDSHSLPYSQVKETDSGRRVPDTAVLQMVAMGRLSVQFSSDAMPEMVALGQACTALDPKDRPTSPEVLYKLHALLKEMHKEV
ncbi:hypothetical protein FI667_g14804, partial [Globisporangium splendens]